MFVMFNLSRKFAEFLIYIEPFEVKSKAQNTRQAIRYSLLGQFLLPLTFNVLANMY